MPKPTLLCIWDEDHCAIRTTVPPSKIPLYLPSAALRLNAIDLTTQNTIVDNEWQLHIAQANDILAALHKHLLLKSYLMAWQQCFSQGQRYGTEVNSLFHQVEAKIATDIVKYQRIYKALSSMSVKLQRFEWQGILHPLKNEDV